MQKRTERTEKPLCSHCLVSLSGDPLQPFRSGVTNNRRITSYNYSRRIEVTNNRNQLVLCWHSSYGGRQHLFRLSLVLVFGFEIVFCYCFQWERAVASHLKSVGSLKMFLNSMSPFRMPWALAWFDYPNPPKLSATQWIQKQFKSSLPLICF